MLVGLDVTALCYMQLAKVLNPAEATGRLASNIGTEPSCSWQDINRLKQFVCVFPACQARDEILRKRASVRLGE